MKLRPDTGRIAFLISGVTTAILKLSGTQLSMSEQLTNFVIDGSSMSLHYLMRNVGHRSNRQDFVGEFLMILSSTSSGISVKAVIFGGSEGRTSFSVPEETKVSLIVLILFRKKKANWSANDLSDSRDGSVTSETLYLRLSILFFKYNFWICVEYPCNNQ